MDNQNPVEKMLLEIISKQENLGQAVEQLIRNVKKDSKERKSRAYYTERQARLTDLCKQFTENHAIIISQDVPDTLLDHNYFKKGYYDGVKKLVDVWLETFKIEGENSAALEGVIAKPATSRKSSDMAAHQVPVPEMRSTREHTMETTRSANEPILANQVLFSTQNALMESLKDLKQRLTLDDPSGHTKSFYLGKVKLITDRLNKMEEIDSQIASSTQPTINGYSTHQFLKFQEEMMELVDELHELSENVTSSHSEAVPPTRDDREVPLPKIQIPKFDGSFSQWTQFKELFVELIHKKHISEVQKMYYLSTFVTGEAKNLIKHLSMSPENYNIAWEIVTSRYDNKRLLVTELMNKFLSQPNSSSESAASLKELHDVTIECMHGLKAQGIPVDQWDILVAHLLIKKLDRSTHTAFEQALADNRNPVKLESAIKFLEHRFQSLEALGKGGKSSSTKTAASVVKARPNEAKCKICNGNKHQLYFCTKFRDDTLSNKWKSINQLNLCSNCLKFGHKANECKSGHCKLCEKKHHTILHPKNTNTQEAERSTPQISPSTSSLLSGDAVANNKYVLLGTARVLVTANNGQQLECRAILDSGSQINVATERLIKKLMARTSTTVLKIEGIGKTSKSSHHRANLTVHSRVNNFTTAVDAHVLPQIVSQQPSQEIDTTKWSLPENIKLADPDFGCPGKIDLLLGAEFHHQLLRTGKIAIGKNLPVLQNSVFGWIAAGKVQQPSESTAVCGVCSDDDLEEAIAKFWKIEEATETGKPMTIEEKLCEEHFLTNTTRMECGRILVKLPFAGDVTLLGDSKALAYNRLMALEKRLAKFPDLKNQYIEFMEEYEKLGHMTEIKHKDVIKPQYFIPHHCVMRPESTSTKLRVVFDASAKTTTGVSLNELMYTGRTVQSELFSILLRFRMPRFVFKTDIEKMYRQIVVHSDDRMLQLIMWRRDSTEPIKYFQLNTVTYGTRAAPFLATRCLDKIADENMNTLTAGASALKNNFYVDDGLVGADSIPEAIEIKNQLTIMLKNAGMNPKKWSANSSKLMQGIPAEDHEINLDFDHNSCQSIKTLGLHWLPTTDDFCVRASINPAAQITKRQVTSELARIFDPLGLVAPVVVTAKIFIQNLWNLQLDWDTTIPPELHTKWTSFRTQLQSLNNVKIQRHIFNHQEKLCIQLHAFCDASEKAYGACIYIRSIKRDKSVMVRLLCSKNRVAPVKPLTIPRLELCAAVLAAELMTRVKTDLNLHKAITYYWSDSQIVLSWINQRSVTFQAFVAHRIQKIQNLSISEQWHHVPSTQNPADSLSRGINPNELANCHMWFFGPMFLYKNEDTWWSKRHQQTEESTLERKAISLASATVTHAVPLIHTINARNNFRTLQNIIGYVLRFVRNSRIPKLSRPEILLLSPTERNSSLKHIVKEIQDSEFSDLKKKLQRREHLPPSHNLSSLTPFLDEEGILRVGGRTNHSFQSYDAKHQMLLPFNNPIVKLLMEAIHRENYHCTAKTLREIMRLQFWPINDKEMLRSVVHHCVRCRRAQPKLYKQIMGQLPAARVQPARPFAISGVDYFGPIKLHFNGRGRHPLKAYVAIFCCFSTKAVHLELVSNLSTEAFIGALKRFTAIRGACKTLYSDNATNFVGARNFIQEAISSPSAQDKIIQTCSLKGIDFRFIPPRSPHFGGLWEAAVKSAKHLLLRSLEAESLTDEQLRTAIAEVGAILNSRPLTPMSNDPNDLNALTPGHFLIGEPMVATFDEHTSQTSGSMQDKWKRVTQLKKKFWDRWSKEYLSSLQHKYKWKGPITDISEGTLVIMKEDNLPVLQWPLGRIVKVYRGEDHIVRVVDVKTEKGIFKRAIQRLAPLLPDDGNKMSAEKRDVALPETHNKKSTQVSDVSTQGQGDNEDIPCKRRRFKPSMLHVAIVAILLLPLALATQINVTRLSNSAGIHFEEVGNAKLIVTNWQILVYFDLGPFQNDLRLLMNGTEALKELCYTAGKDSPCPVVIPHFHHIEDELNAGFKFLSRSKRGAVNVIGNIANSLFGVLDSNYEEKMSQTIAQIQGNEAHMTRLLKNQTSLIDSTLNIVKKNQGNIKLKFDEIDKQLNAIHTELTDGPTARLHSTQAVLNLSLQLLMLTASLQQIRLAILDVLIDSHHGRVNPLLLTPQQFSEEINKIKTHLPAHLHLPLTHGDLLEFYKLMDIDGTIAENHVIFHINIPLVDQRSFHIYYLTPIATVVNDIITSITLTTSWIAINDHRDEFFPMTEKTIEACLHINNNTYLCQNIQSTFHEGTNTCKCELDFFKGETSPKCQSQRISEGAVWTQLHDKNKWIYATKSPLRVTTVCNGQGDVMSLTGTGIVQLQAECTLKSNNLTIHGFKHLSSTVYTSYISTGTLTTNFSMPSLEHTEIHPYSSQIKELTQLQEELTKLEVFALPDKLNSTFTHSISIAYGALGITSVILIVMVIKLWALRTRNNKRCTAPQKPPRARSTFDISTI